MEQQAIQELIDHVDWVVMMLFIVGGMFAKNYLTGWRISNAWKTLIVGSVFVSIYVLVQLAIGKFEKDFLDKYVFTYFCTTSLYELILKHFFNLLSRINLIERS